jgi:hypothetical protein
MPTRPPIVPSSGNWPSLLNDESGGPDQGLIQGVKIGGACLPAGRRRKAFPIYRHWPREF